tara:strand:+ start:10548 stop:12686 length:2139 start_codon:yes stop_codon:yes gene_type:complete
MASLAEIRQQYPQYQDMSDQQLADGLYGKFYSDMPRDQFNQNLGIVQGGEAMQAASTASQRLTGKVSDLPSKQPARPDLFNSTMATVNGLAASVPFLQNTTDAIGGTISQLTGGDYQGYIDHQRQVRQGYADAAPLARVAGEVGGAIGSVGALGATKLGAEALGLAGNPWMRLGNSTLSSAGLAGADSLSRGETGADTLKTMGMGGAFGAAMPIVGAGVRAAGRSVRNNIIDPVATMLNPDNAAASHLGKAIGADRRAGQFMTAADEAAARNADVPVINADRFGKSTRTLARTASNIDNEAGAKFSRVVEDRFKGQGDRAVRFLKKIMGGATDDLQLQDKLEAAARVSNKTAYDAAYASPQARAIWSPKIRQLMQADEMKTAVKAAEKAARTESALTGGKPVKNPFIFNADDTLSETLAKQADGSTALPSLEFWDIVQRELRKSGAAAMRSGGPDAARPFTRLRNELVSELDKSVPAFKQARSGAASFFGTDGALDAGRKAVKMTKEVPELERAHAAFKPAEKEAASVGYASQLIDEIGAAGDSRNLMITKLFDSPSARARNELFLGKARARELEALVKVETIVDALRGAVKGNSTTAEQLISAGAIGTGVGLGTGDLSTGAWSGIAAALAMKGLKVAGKSVDEKVMNMVAEALLSSNPAQIQKAIQNATLSQRHMDALNAIMKALSVGGRGAALSALPQQRSGPVEISVPY